MEAASRQVGREDDPATDEWISAADSERVRSLLVSGLYCFAERGYHGTSTRWIAQRAGMSPAAVYVHFASKNRLLGEIVIRGNESALAAINQGLMSLSDQSPTARLRAVVYAFTAWHVRHHGLARVAHSDLDELDPGDFQAMVALRRTIEGILIDVIEEVGALDGEKARGTAIAILGMSIDVSRWYSLADGIAEDDLGMLHAELAQRMVFAD